MKNALVVRRKRTRVRRSPDEIRVLLGGYHSSGMSQVAYARRAGVSVSTLNYWLRQERRGEAPEPGRRQGLVEVKIAPVPDDGLVAPPGRFELSIPGGARLWIPSDFEVDALRRLLCVLSGPC